MITRVCALGLLLLFAGSRGVVSYSQVAIAGSGPANDNGPKVFKALNMDLIYPKSFNASENVISTTDGSAAKPRPEIVESLSPTAGEQFTPERSSSDVSSAQPPSQPPAVAVVTAEQPIPVNHYTPPPFFVTPANRGSEESGESEAAATSSPPATATASGRAVDYRPAYPFAQLLTPNSKGYRPSASAEQQYSVRSRPVVSRPIPAAERRVVYPSYQASRTPSRAEIDKLSGKGYFSDRFTPSEAVVSAAFKRKPARKPSNSRPVGQPSNKVSTIVSPKDLYSFPPNSNARYPSPSDVRQASPSDTVSSYLPPPAGPVDANKLVGPVNPDLLPKSKDTAGDGYHYDAPPMNVAQSGYLYEPPKTGLDSHLDIPDTPAPMNDGGGMMNMDDMDAGPAPDGMMGMDDNGAPPDDHDHDHDHEHDHDVHDHDHHDFHDAGGYVDGKEYPTPPPGYEADHDHDHDHDHHHSDIDFAHGPYFHDHHDYDHHHYPDIVYDDYHDHHHFHHDDHPTMPPMPTEAPPPPPPPAPEMPRVKKYSYFYIGRKLWYIPLYFTVWFTFYVLWLILKSIARHKTNLPNHYVSRRSIEELNHREAREAIDKLTIKVMDGIERFKEKFIG